jgi:hypothetical protein
VLSLVFVGFSHQVPGLAGDQVATSEIAQYVLPDGTIPILCTTIVDDNGTEHGKIAHLHPCDACQITASVILPEPTDVVGSHIGFVATIGLPLRAEAIHRQLYPPNTGPRAPPPTSILA